MQLDAERLALRAVGRHQAREMITMLQELAPSPVCEETLLAFWDEVQAFVAAQLPPAEGKARPELLAACTAREALAFEDEPAPYGEFAGQPSSKIPLDRLDWYVQKHEENAGWIKRAARYLLHRKENG